jgi:predicted amidohydrolase
MRVALCQIQSTESPDANLALVHDGVRAAVRSDAELVVFPEATMARFGVNLATVAEPLDGPWAASVRAIADEHGVTVVAGMFTPADGDRVRNTLLVAGPDGVLGYEKIHLYDAFGFRESRTVAPGDKPTIVPVGETTIGLAICYDVRFPELFVDLAERGATVMVLPASWGSGPGKLAQWELLVRARALDTVSWVVAAAQAYPPASGLDWGDGPYGVGHSMVVAPDGTVVARLAEEPDVLVADVDPNRALDLRRSIPVLDNRVLPPATPVQHG